MTAKPLWKGQKYKTFCDDGIVRFINDRLRTKFKLNTRIVIDANLGNPENASDVSGSGKMLVGLGNSGHGLVNIGRGEPVIC